MTFDPKLFFLNLEGINFDKINEILTEMLIFKNMYFFCFNETWTNELSMTSYQLDGYKLASFYSRLNCKRGGVAIYIRNDLSYKPIDLKKYCFELDIEVCAISCNLSNAKTILLNCYRSPDGNIKLFLEKIDEVLNSIFDPNCNFIVCGDFNFNCLATKCSHFLKLSNIFSSYGLFHRGGWPTRVTDTSTTSIDHIFTNVIEFVSCVYDNTLSDHRTTLGDFNISSKKSNRFHVWRRSYNEDALLNFKRSIQNEAWLSVYNCSLFSESFDSFFNIIQYYFNKHFPLHKSCREISSKSWVSNTVKISSNNLKDLYYFSQRNPELRPFYKDAKKQHTKLVRETKKSFYQNKIFSSDSTTKACWQVVNQVTNKKPMQKNNITLRNHKNERVNEPASLSNIFNDFFNNAPNEILQKINISSNIPDFSFNIKNNFKLCPYTEIELGELLLAKLKNSKSYGFDELPNFLIKQILLFIIKPLTHLVNLSFCCGEFPSRLKLGKVIPIFKKGDEYNVENYRPITVPSVFSKIFEYAFLNRLLLHLQNNKILSENQHGFRNGKSTISAVHSFYEELIKLIDAGECPVGIFCDLSRAFDCVDYNKFLVIIKKYGIVGKSLDWSRSFLVGRKQYVSIQHTDSKNNVRNFSSQSLDISMGVPQGSVLGPIFFILFINQFDNIDSNTFFTAYADDISALISDKLDNVLTNSCNDLVKYINFWFSNHSLYLNPSKTKLMRFHHAQNKTVKELDIVLGEDRLSFNASAKFLGLYIDSNISWKAHCEYLIPKITSQSYVLRQLKTILTTEQLIQIYFANVDSRLRYGVCFWGWSPFSDDVFVAQKRCIRSLAGISPIQSCKQFFVKFNILTVPSLFIFELCLYVFSNSNKFKRNCDIHHINTRNSENLHTNLTKSKVAFRSPHNMGPLLFNKLPNDIKIIKTISQFKLKLKQFLVQKCFYRVDEYLQIVI